jgi:hypothetical protein
MAMFAAFIGSEKITGVQAAQKDLRGEARMDRDRVRET